MDHKQSAQPSGESFADDFETFLDQLCDDELQSATRDVAISVTPSASAAKRSVRAKHSPVAAVPRPRPLTREQRKRLVNRASQRQWRERQKTTAEDLEARLEATTAQLKVKQATLRQLEAKNALLEIGNPNASDEESQHIYTLGNVDLTDLMRDDTQQTLTLTILDGPPQVKTRQDVSKMSFAEFAMLTAAYARKLGHCFVELTKADATISSPAVNTRAASNSPPLHSRAVPSRAVAGCRAAANSSPLDQLRKWTRECSSLRAFLVIGNPNNYMAYVSQRLDGRPGLSTSELGSQWHHDMLAAMQFTEAQQQDLMLLRRLFFGKLGVLARERRDCLKRMPYGAAATSHEVNNRLSEVVAIAQELHDITAAEYQTKLQFTSAYRRGIYTLTQQAMSMVKAFPYIAEKPQIFEILAAERGEPSAMELMQPAGQINIEHNARWQQIVQYLTTVTAENLDLHVPIIKHDLGSIIC